MSITITYEVTLNTLGEILRFWREEKELALRDMSDRASELLWGTKTVTHTTVARYEANEFPKDGPNPLLLAAMIEVTGHRIKDLPEEFRMELEQGTDLLSRNTYSAESSQRAA